MEKININPPETLDLTDNEVETILTIRTILRRGNSAEVKRKNGQMIVYEVKKEKK